MTEVHEEDEWADMAIVGGWYRGGKETSPIIDLSLLLLSSLSFRRLSKQDRGTKAIASTEKRAVAEEENKGKKWEEPGMETASAPSLFEKWKETTKKLIICF